MPDVLRRCTRAPPRVRAVRVAGVPIPPKLVDVCVLVEFGLHTGSMHR
jgi:hypothetical protein